MFTPAAAALSVFVSPMRRLPNAWAPPLPSRSNLRRFADRCKNSFSLPKSNRLTASPIRGTRWAMTHSEIIVGLGDTVAVAGELGRKIPTVSNWKKYGIPWRWRMSIARMAKDRKMDLPADFLVPLS